MEGNNVVERQKNVLQIEALATESITTAVRSLLPVKQILKDYLEDDEEDEVVEAEAPVTPVVRPSEEAKEEEVAATVEEKAPAPKVEEAKEEVKAKEEEKVPTVAPAAAPAVVKIDTEPAVSFSDYDEVFSKSSAPELVHVPRLEDDDDGPSDGLLKIDESSSRSIGDDDVEDLEAPKPKAKPAAVPALPPKEESLDSDIVVLE
jgi:hypothetical protein